MFCPQIWRNQQKEKVVRSYDQWSSYTFFGVVHPFTAAFFICLRLEIEFQKANEQGEIRIDVPSTRSTKQNWKKIKKPLCLKQPPAFFHTHNPPQQETLQYESQLSVFWLMLLCLFLSMGEGGI